MDSQADTVLIIDAGSQYCKLIDRAIRNLCVRTVIAPFDIHHDEILANKYKAVVISGGPSSVVDGFEDRIFDKSLFDIGIPILGICYGLQLIVKIFGGKVVKSQAIESSLTPIHISNSCLLYKGLSADQVVLMTHSDNCVDIPPFFTVNAKTSNDVVASISNDQTKLYGVQFHPEVELTKNGTQMFRNFLFEIANCNPNFTPESKLLQLERAMLEIKPDINLVCMSSGGVDSTVCAVLVNKYLQNNKKYFVMVDTGLLRANEAENVKMAFSMMGMNLIVVPAEALFMNAHAMVDVKNSNGLKMEVGPLRICSQPEHKRQIIGNTFIHIVGKVLEKFGLSLDNTLLVQGTLRPDMIESGSSLVSLSAHTIKTHHNDSYEARVLRHSKKLLEPLMDFHKDEVRQLAECLDLPLNFLKARPFPGPGLAIRIICQEKPIILDLEEKFDVALMAQVIANYHSKSITSKDPSLDMIKKSISPADLEELLQATHVNYHLTATLIPILSVGVQGDSRTYKNCIALSSNESNVYWDGLEVITRIIPKICTSINRVVYSFGPQIVSKIEQVTLTFLTPEVIELSRMAHAIVENILKEEAPFSSMKRSLVLRPFISNDFMTGLAAIPGRDINHFTVLRIRNELLKLPGISRILYDLSSKPPSTTEWE